jgi:hypothetical protein
MPHGPLADNVVEYQTEVTPIQVGDGDWIYRFVAFDINVPSEADAPKAYIVNARLYAGSPKAFAKFSPQAAVVHNNGVLSIRSVAFPFPGAASVDHSAPFPARMHVELTPVEEGGPTVNPYGILTPQPIGWSFVTPDAFYPDTPDARAGLWSYEIDFTLLAPCTGARMHGTGQTQFGAVAESLSGLATFTSGSCNSTQPVDAYFPYVYNWHFEHS